MSKNKNKKREVELVKPAEETDTPDNTESVDSVKVEEIELNEINNPVSEEDYKYKINGVPFRLAKPDDITDESVKGEIPKYTRELKATIEEPDNTLKILHEEGYYVSAYALGEYKLVDSVQGVGLPMEIKAVDHKLSSNMDLNVYFSNLNSYPTERIRELVLINKEGELATMEITDGDDWGINRGKFIMPLIPEISKLNLEEEFKNAPDLLEKDPETYKSVALYVAEMLKIMLFHNHMVINPKDLDMETLTIMESLGLKEVDEVYALPMFNVLALNMVKCMKELGLDIDNEVSFIGDPEALFPSDNKYTTYYYREKLELLRELSGKNTCIILCPIGNIKDRGSNGDCRISKFKITIYSKNVEKVVCLLLSFKHP